MPWSNQTGNGGWKGGGGNGGGPWGQRPQSPRPGGSGGGSPDLEDILRRGQDRLRRAMPGGGGSGFGGNGPAVMGWGVVIVAVVAVLWLFKAVYTVQPDEVGVEMLFGKPKQELSQPGLHFMLWPLETVETVPTVESQMTIGGSATSSDNSGLMLSGDQNIVDVQFAVLYQVDNPTNYLFDVQDPVAMLQQVSESAMREVVGRRPVQDVFRDDRAGIAEEVRKITQDTMNEYDAGLRVNAISIEDAAPPSQVADAFDEVQRAEQDEDRFVEEANRYRNKQLGGARGEAAQIREDAAAYKNRVVQESEGEAQRFTSIQKQFDKAPEITRKRMFLETMEGVLRDSNKVIVEQGAGGQGVIPYLPLPELQGNNPNARRTSRASGTGTDQNAGVPSSSNGQSGGQSADQNAGTK